MMTEVPGMPWEQPQTSNPEPPAREPRQKRKPKEAAAPKERKPRAAAAETAPEPAKTRKPRAAKPEMIDATVKATIKVTLKQYAEMVVGGDAKAFIKLHGLLAALGKASRAKVLAELQKVFG